MGTIGIMPKSQVHCWVTLIYIKSLITFTDACSPIQNSMVASWGRRSPRPAIHSSAPAVKTASRWADVALDPVVAQRPLHQAAQQSAPTAQRAAGATASLATLQWQRLNLKVSCNGTRWVEILVAQWWWIIKLPLHPVQNASRTLQFLLFLGTVSKCSSWNA